MLLDRLRTYFRSGKADLAARFGNVYQGVYAPSGQRITGTVADGGGNKRFPPASLIVLIDGVIAGSTETFKGSEPPWHFQVDFSEPFMPEHITRERLKVFALDQHGARSALRIDGAAQLAYLRDAFAPPSEIELEIDFTEGGNSREYVRDGWSCQEISHTWSDAEQSTVCLPFKQPGSSYGLEILGWPFTVAGRIPGQTVEIWIDDNMLARENLFPANSLLECTIPPELTRDGSATIRLKYSDAMRPSDIDGARESRMLGLACRRMRLKRFLGAEASSKAAADLA